MVESTNRHSILTHGDIHQEAHRLSPTTLASIDQNAMQLKDVCFILENNKISNKYLFI